MSTTVNTAETIYRVSGPDIRKEYQLESDALACAIELRRNARFGPEVTVLCIERSDSYETHQRIWPSIGPVYANHR